jgi:amidase
MTPIGLGNDIGGSLRNPAACCGIASLKPSHGVVPGCTTIPGPDAPPSFQLMPVEGPMARTVADVRLGLSILAGRDRRDPYSLPVPPRPAPPEGRPLRVALLDEPPGGATDPRVAERTRAAADALTDGGYDVVTTPPPHYEDVIATWTDFIVSDIRFMREMIAPMMGTDAIGFLDAILDARPALDLAAYTGVMMARQSLMREWAMWFADVDVLLTPTWTQLPFAHGWDVDSVERAMATLELIRPVVPANVLGLPSACVPAGLVDGLPVGVLLTADRFADETALDAAAVVEAALGLDTPIDPVAA